MSCNIDLSVLCTLLKKQPSATPELLYQLPEEDRTDGVEYLLESVWKPLLYDEPLLTDQVDMGRFTLDDLNTLAAFCEQTFECSLAQQRKLYMACLQSTAITRPVAFL